MSQASDKFPIKPLRDRIVIEPEETPEKVGAVYVPTTSVEMRQFKGTVMAVGSGIMTDSGQVIPLIPRVGDRVLFSSYAGDPLEYQGRRYLIVSEQNVLAVLPPADVRRTPNS